MNSIDVEETLNYLSIKFNKIFCDREFVTSVSEDLKIVLENKQKCFVLVFPALGPLYLKAIRYQAKRFDLVVFGISAGTLKGKTVAVCHKNHIINTPEVVEPPKMEDPSVSRRKRPERQLYVPPAQRRSTVSEAKRKPSKVVKCCAKEKTVDNKNTDKINADLCVGEVLRLISQVFLTWKYKLNEGEPCNHQNCDFLTSFKSKYCVPIYKTYQDFFLCILHNNAILWTPQLNVKLPLLSKEHKFSVFRTDLVSQTNIQKVCQYTPVLVQDQVQELLHDSENTCCEVLIPSFVSETNVLDLSDFNLGHFVSFIDHNKEFMYSCMEDHDTAQCHKQVVAQLKDIKIMNTKRKNAAKKAAVPEIIKISNDKNEIINISKPSTDTNKDNIINKKENAKTMKTSSRQTTHEQEKEIMRKAKENINRKTRPIMKYSDEADDVLKIDRNDDVNDWEDLFNEDGEIQEDLLAEIAQKVGTNVTIVKATEDYTAYANKPTEELEHIVELYNFPPTLGTADLIHAFSEIDSDSMYVKWVDDTHALLILGSSSQAQRAVELDNPIIKVRPITVASSVSLAVANKSDLRPAMKRPQTNLQTARRLITTHLGAKSKVTKEQSDKEREHLRNAREMKKLARQNEKDAWEGNIKSSLK